MMWSAAGCDCAEAMLHTKHVKEIRTLSFMETNEPMDAFKDESVIGKVRGCWAPTRRLPLQKLTILNTILVESIVTKALAEASRC